VVGDENVLKLLAGAAAGLLLAAFLLIVIDNPDLGPDLKEPVRLWHYILGVGAVAQSIFAGVALLSLHYANRTLQHQQETTEKQLRAYFDVVTPTVECADEDKPIRLSLLFKNAGTTPLTRGELRWRPIYEEWEGDDCTETRYPWIYEQVPPVLPSDTWPLMVRIQPGLDRFNRDWFIDSRLGLVLEYEVDYSDAFPARRRTIGRVRMIHKDDEFILVNDGGGAMT
jgi:hypothetical protein